MEYMALGSLESVRKRLGGTIPESVLGKTAYCVIMKNDIDYRPYVDCNICIQNSICFIVISSQKIFL